MCIVILKSMDATYWLLTLFNKYESRRQQQALTHKYDGVYLYYRKSYYKQSASGFNYPLPAGEIEERGEY